MFYETVLWYTENTLIQEYREKYFQVLLTFFCNSHIEEWIKWSFLKLDEESKKNYLLHPDISSLVHDLKNKSSIDKLEKEMKSLYSGLSENITMNSWENIPNTDIKLTLHDNNPYNFQVGHPDHDQDGMLWWGEKSEKEWLDVFWKAFSLLQKVDEKFFQELNYIIKKIVPMKTSLDVHNSCSYKECIGTLYLGYTINARQPELNILEALIHESSHNKLNLIMQSERLHLNDYQLAYYSPYRPDARHIQWVLLWVHAIVPTVYVILRGIEQGYIKDKWWHEKVILYHIKNKLGLRVLWRYAKFTSIGRKIFDDISEVIKISDAMIQKIEVLQSLEKKSIQNRAKEHFLEVQRNYLHLKY